MIFTKTQKARYDKLIHKGGDHGIDGELWNRHDLHIIIHGLLGKRLTKHALDAAEVCPNCNTRWQFHDPRVCSIEPPRQ